jgi:TorA maturation chaperone TorD
VNLATSFEEEALRMSIPEPTVHDPTDTQLLGLSLQLVVGVYASPGDALRADLEGGAFQEAVALAARPAGLTAPDLDVPPWRTLQARYVDLFVSSPNGLPAPPYVGYAVDGELLGPTARRLKAFYDEHGVTPNGAWGDLPDHLAAVAEAGTLLVEAGRPDAARTLAARFLLPWFERYAEPVVDADTSGFYGPMTRFLHAAIKEVTREAAVHGS